MTSGWRQAARAFLVATGGLALAGSPAAARNIVIVNDDGLTSNVVALYAALKAQGHDVVVSVPCQNQSGQGAALAIGRPMGPLAQACLNGAAEAGAPGAGPMTRKDLPGGGADFSYVDGTPVAALLHGLDVVAKARWGKAPDLVLSGPNEGQNVGAIILSSGTVSAAQVAAMRGIPAVALSAGSNTVGANLANPLSHEVARRAAELVASLEAKAGSGPLLPQGLALNVNFPDRLERAPWRLARIGSFNAYAVTFSPNMAETASPLMRAMAQSRGTPLPPVPGVSLDLSTAAPAPGQAEDEAVVVRSAIAVSPMQAGYAYAEGAPPLDRAAIAALLPEGAK
ncbi:MAG: 5'/3'-nucleotidase SurE [Erythrobacter sp.]